MAYWILKTEPNTYSLSDLKKDRETDWDGVRNYQARNNLRLMEVGDLAMIYHSVGPKELVGVAKVVKTFYPDATATDGDWVAVRVKFETEFKNPIHLSTIKADPFFANLSLVKQGRLSVCPVNKSEWQKLLKMSSD
jgi:predicted RNA-binding protein with PUA-like domain